MSSKEGGIFSSSESMGRNDGGIWYDGKIAAIHSLAKGKDNFDITYADGSKEAGVPASTAGAATRTRQ